MSALALRTSALVRTRASALARSYAAPAPQFVYQDLFEAEKKKETPYKKLTGDYVSTSVVNGKTVFWSFDSLFPQ
jgi:hypothetical protein